MLKKLYDWVLSLSARKSAEIWLAIIAVIESSVFLVPADVLFLPMALARPQRAYRYALIATTASVVGGILGYLLGWLAFETFIKPMLSFYGELARFEQMKACTSIETLLVLLATSGLAHLPPIKIVTILAGVVQINFIFFVVSCILARNVLAQDAGTRYIHICHPGWDHHVQIWDRTASSNHLAVPAAWC